MGIQVAARQAEDVSVVGLVGRITLGEGGSTLRETIRGLVSKATKRFF
jgi:hypothetical protein